MTVVDLVSKEAAGEQRKLLITANLAGAANAAILGTINAAARSPDGVSLPSLVLFVSYVAVFVICSRLTLHRVGQLFEDALKTIRLRIESKIRRADMQRLERIGTAEIYDRMTENISIVSESATVLANFMQSICVVLFGALYIAYVSLPALALVTLLLVIGVAMYLGQRTETYAHLRQAAQMRLAFHDHITDLLRGIKEVKASRKRSDELHEDFVETAEVLRVSTVKANQLFDDKNIFANAILLALLGALVYIVPEYTATTPDVLAGIVSAVLFIWGPIAGVVGGIAVITRSNLAITNIEKLEEKLDEALASGEEQGGSGRIVEVLEAIELEHVEFTYTAAETEESFRIGPVSLTIPAGELLFIVGGNGSGKSTLLKVLTGLYPPTTGALRVNGLSVRPANAQGYRELISVVHGDFHLFKKLYGLRGVDDAEVARLIRQMHLERKVTYANRRFSTTNLSTGQRKRLALIAALLEDRPVYAFDEWAADQDPEFRRYFYEDLLPELKRRGKTVLVVTHDDRFFNLADRVVVMDYGVVRTVQTNKPAP